MRRNSGGYSSFLLIIPFVLALAACGGAVSSPGGGPGSTLISITTSGLPDGQVQVAYLATLAATGGVNPYTWSVASGQLPQGLALDGASGVIAGTPSAAGQFSFTIQVSDSSQPTAQTDSRALALTIGSVSQLQIITNALATARTQQSYQATMSATGGVAPYTWRLASGLLPLGLMLGAASGDISGTPTETGQFNITVEVTDSSQPSPQSATKAFTLSVAAGQTDQFGGILALPSPGGATGNWRVEKFGNRWLFVTPEGNAFWMTGVYTVTGGSATDELGGNYNARIKAKYGDDQTAWPQANRRLLSWGFNTIGPFSFRMTLPTNTENHPEWPGGMHPVKMPFLGLAPNPGITNRDSGLFKNLYPGLDPANFVDSGNFPDVFDPAWETNAINLYTNDPNLATFKSSPYFIGYFSDDTDFLSGFGVGVDFPSDPVGKFHAHLGYIALVMAPTQATNPFSSPPNNPYADTTVHTKFALKDFLTAKYGTINALNTAWGSNYTTFDSDGGWPNGNGLLDENGRASHTWLGSQDRFFLSGMDADAKADLDDFLFEIAKKYFTVNRDAFKAIAPDKLFFGPTNLGGAGWRAPARGPILKAAGQYLDVVNIGTDGSQAQLDFVAQWAGDVPVAIWEGVVANADSGRWRSNAEAATWNVATQALRGQQYQQDVQALLNGVATPTGSKPYVGLLWWAWTDSLGEQQNWGLVSLLDNAYDGKEATVAPGVDSWGFPTGGEERDYGDAISLIKSANLDIVQLLIAELNP